MSRAIMAGKMSSMEKRLRPVRRAAWKQKDLRAGIGMRAAERKAATLQIVVVRTETPAFRRTSPTWSWGKEMSVREEVRNGGKIISASVGGAPAISDGRPAAFE